jgi:hypothetical protein
VPNPTTSLIPPPFAPDGWPVVCPELLMGYVGSVLVIRIGGSLDQGAFGLYLREWERSVVARPADADVFALYDMPEWPGLTALQRKAWAGMLASHERVLRRTTRGVVLASPSSLTRGGARALFWLAPPPYPYAVVDAPRAGFEYIAQRGGPPAASAHAAYEQIVRKHWVGEL